MTTPLTLTAADGVRLRAYHEPGPLDQAFVVAHGFTGSAHSKGMREIRRVLAEFGGVLALDLRGHGTSAGESTLGDLEVLDVAAAVEAARELGYERVATIGFSMGASIVVRHAALANDRPDAVVSVSGPGFWYYRGTPQMRWVHRTIGSRFGRGAARVARRTRIAPNGWDPEPESPQEVAALIAPAPFLVVHGDQDAYFPLEHAERLFAAAAGAPGSRAELWVEGGFGHAESSASPELVRRIAGWTLERLRESAA